MDNNARPNAENYVFDGLHLSARGYGVWRDIIRAHLSDELGGFSAADGLPN